MTFVTGSFAFGTPTAQSDIDVVVLVDEDTAATIRTALACPKGTTVRAGRLNLILCTSPEDYAIWRVGTLQLQAQVVAQNMGQGGDPFNTAPRHTFDKKVAKAFLDTLFEAAGRPRCGPQTDSGGPMPYVP